MQTSKELYQKLWNSADILRSNMDASEYKSYLLGLIFYKYLSDSQLEYVGELLEVEDGKDLSFLLSTYRDFYESEDADDLIDELEFKFSYAIRPSLTFTALIEEIDESRFELAHLAQAFSEIENSNQNFENLFEDIDLYSKSLGQSLAKQNETIAKVMKEISGLDLAKYSGDVLGDVYEYMIGNFAQESGKKAGEFYTPQEVSTLMAKIAMAGKEDVMGFTVYDPTMGSGSLLLNPRKFSNEKDTIKYYGQEKNNRTYNLARMNMILHAVPLESQVLSYGDTLAEDWPSDEPWTFDAVLMNPPYSAKWSAAKGFINDPRFADFGGVLPPKSKADLAFLLHGLYHLKADGTMIIVLPHGPLFRGGAEGKIRRALLENGSIDGIIGLPANVFFNTSIPTILMILRKDKTDRSVFFIDAKDEFEKEGTQNILTEENIEKIAQTYLAKEEIDKFSHLADFNEIKENDFNLNIPRYVDTFEEEEPVDMIALASRMEEVERALEADKTKLTSLLDQLEATDDKGKTALDKIKKALGGQNA